MNKPMRIRVEELGKDGQWHPAGVTPALTPFERRQIALVLAGIDPAVFEALPSEAQNRVLADIAGMRPAYQALN